MTSASRIVGVAASGARVCLALEVGHSHVRAPPAGTRRPKPCVALCRLRYTRGMRQKPVPAAVPVEGRNLREAVEAAENAEGANCVKRLPSSRGRRVLGRGTDRIPKLDVAGSTGRTLSEARPVEQGIPRCHRECHHE